MAMRIGKSSHNSYYKLLLEKLQLLARSFPNTATLGVSLVARESVLLFTSQTSLELVLIHSLLRLVHTGLPC